MRCHESQLKAHEKWVEKNSNLHYHRREIYDNL